MTDCPTDGAPVAQAPEIRYTLWPNRFATSKHDVAHSWRDLCEGVWSELPSTEKDRCRLIKLATFGEARTDKGSLRHDANVLEVTGIEGDHDAGTMSPLEAIERLELYGLRALVYTSWSHRPESPRWRVLAPLSRPVKPADRLPLVEALNGLLDGALARESATLSQSFYIGRNPTAEVWIGHTFGDADEGFCLDELDTWQQYRRPLATNGASHDTPSNKPHSDALAELLAGDDVHGNALRLVGRLVRERLSDDAIKAVFAGLALQVRDVRGPDRAACLTGPELQRMIDGARKKGYRTEHTQRPSGHAGNASDPSIDPGTVTIINAADVQVEPIDWLWNGWLARGKVHVLAGAPGTGKTTLALALAATITLGGRWPNGDQAARGRVMVWSSEDAPHDTLVPRLMAAGADLSRVDIVNEYVQGQDVRPFDPSKDARALSDRIADMDEPPVLLIIDPIVSAVAGDSNKAAEVRRALQPLVDLGLLRRTAVLGISHFSKGSAGRDPAERVTGSLSFGALARVVLATARRSDADGGGRILARAKSNIGPDTGAFQYDLDVCQLDAGIVTTRILWGDVLEGSARDLLAEAEAAGADPEERSAIEEARDFLLEELRMGPVPANEVQAAAGKLGINQTTLRRAKALLGIKPDKQGFQGKWVWRLPPKV